MIKKKIYQEIKTCANKKFHIIKKSVFEIFPCL